MVECMSTESVSIYIMCANARNHVKYYTCMYETHNTHVYMYTHVYKFRIMALYI